MKNKLHPEAIFIQLLTHCNAECINCPFEFTYNSIHPNGRMTDQTWEKILNDIIEMEFQGQVGFYLHHEPLIDKTLFDKIKDVNEKTKAHVVLSTNGQLLTEDKINKLIESKPRKVHLNINSGNKEEYESSMKGLKYETTINNCKNFIEKANGLIKIEINCPVIDGFDVASLENLFPNVKVNLDYWANSRGGLLPDFYKEKKGSRFKVDNYCKQPTQNFNILHDGSVIACCMDWMHETKKDFFNVNDFRIIEIYHKINKLEESFRKGDYTKYKMCDACSKEMGFFRNENKKLKILLTNHQLLNYSGSEVFTYTIANYLTKNGHEVTVYTKFADKVMYLFKEIKVKVYDKISQIKDKEFDVAHVHHNLMAYDIRYHFPSLPLVFLSHGVAPFLEQPPILDLSISSFLAVSEEVQLNILSKGIDKNKTEIFRNIVDHTKFFPKSEISETPKNALIISNKINDEVEGIINNACNKLNIKTRFIGRGFEEIKPNELPYYINQADIVFSLGRGVMEAILCGRIPIIFDRNGGDGIVTSDNIYELMKKNFSGRTKNEMFSVDELVNEINKYDSKDSKKLFEIGFKLFNGDNVRNIEKIYRSAINNFEQKELSIEDEKIIETVFNTQIETTRYNKVLLNRINKRPKKEDLNLKNKSAELLLDNAEKLIQDQNLGEAEKELQKAMSIVSKNSIDTLINLGVIKTMQENYFEAITFFEKVLEIDPSNKIVIENLNYVKEQINLENHLVT